MVSVSPQTDQISPTVFQIIKVVICRNRASPPLPYPLSPRPSDHRLLSPALRPHTPYPTVSPRTLHSCKPLFSLPAAPPELPYDINVVPPNPTLHPELNFSLTHSICFPPKWGTPTKRHQTPPLRPTFCVVMTPQARVSPLHSEPPLPPQRRSAPGHPRRRERDGVAKEDPAAADIGMTDGLNGAMPQFLFLLRNLTSGKFDVAE